MLQYLKPEEIDPALWDACVTESPNGIVYALSWYLNTVSPGWHALVERSEGKYTVVMPLPVQKKFGIAFLKQPILTQQLGVFSIKEISAENWQQIAGLLKMHFSLISQYNFNTGNPENLPAAFAGFSVQKFATYHLDLNKTYPEIFSVYKKNRKWRVNQARKNSLTVRPAQNIYNLFELFETHTAAKIYGFVGKGYTYKFVQELYRQAKANGTGEIYEVTNRQGELLAMAFFTFFRNKIIYLFSTTTPQGREQGAIPFLLDHLLEKYAGSGYLFDFEAPKPNGHGAQPIIAFYESFGPEKVTFLSISLDNLPQPFKGLKQLRIKLYRKFLS